ncbi:hypothetical protein SAMN04488238_1216 [Roseicitreum antarcticum]|uniref:Uncharacterized protein n=1 Tax=Roseicitreum antarcticum TaxID=564137 RepID=A0A1H3EFW1_9RHOB|nr:hypothetical protein SAMN04488238_1216 [Roseicitreum antarcticum]
MFTAVNFHQIGAVERNVHSCELFDLVLRTQPCLLTTSLRVKGLGFEGDGK